ncbi:M16 family metallopeptidase [Novosphingobium lentum]|uniref:M16 family metallopeptidase n=1 Tax=Novosphingobium lentum TaxID=145287 RepID=UPI000831F951|nr:pitrilysin family protein [Novosphingobium lentum]
MRRIHAVSIAVLAAVSLSAASPASAKASASAATRPAPLADLVKAVDIPFETFTLPNGLTTIVHTDRKAPIVGVTVYYRVGSKNEPKGKTGFAHLYEHLFFGGSENVPNFDVPLEAAGSTATNGSTWYDRTNYVETVPTGALPLALFMESDRMGHLLGAVNQDKLDKQRGVVQNEKRQGDNEPYGLVEYAIGEGLFPVGHPYRHATIGSMTDLDAASLADVRQWFTDHYGPNNVVLALAGDIDVATAKPLVARWFGDIPRGPAVGKVSAPRVDLPAPVKREMADQVATTRLYRAWSGPALDDADRLALDIGMSVLGGLSSSRLDNALVRTEQLAVAVSAELQPFEQASFVQVQMDVKPGVGRAKAEARLDALLTDFIDKGPSADEVQRAATSYIAAKIGALEQVGGFSGKGAQLAEGLLYSGDAARYKANLATVAALTPARVRAAMQHWLKRPVYQLTVTPGTRTEKGETMGGWGDESATAAVPKPTPVPMAAIAPGPKRDTPPVTPVGDLVLPTVEHATLSNGIKVSLARRTAVPKVLMTLDFNAGYAADPKAALGTQSLMLGLLDEGTSTRNSIQIAEEQERLGATISANASLDASSITLDALKANLAPSLSLMADIVRNPAFAPGEVARLRDQRLAEIAQAEASPFSLVRLNLNPLIYGPGHPYGVPSNGLGSKAAVAALDPAALRAAHDLWLRPDLATITVVGDVTMSELTPLLEQAFGGWKAPATPAPTKDLAAPIPTPRPRIVVIDRPNSPQSVIAAGKALPVTGSSTDVSLDLANEVLGNDFLSRLNLDLREDKGWSYGVSSAVARLKGPRTFTVAAPVQSDKTGESLKLLIADMKAFPASKPVEPVELNRVTDGNIRGLPNNFETDAELLNALVVNQRLGRPDDYYATLATRYRAVDAKALDAAATKYLQPDGLVFLVVGDRKVIDPQIAGLGLPIEYLAVDNGTAKP